MKKGIVIIAIVGLVATGAYFFYKAQVERLYKMKYKLVGISFDKVSLTQDTVANIKLQISSDSTLEALITDLNIDVSIDGRRIGIITENKPFVIPAKGYSIVDLKIITNLYNTGLTVLDLASQIIRDKDLTITLSGKAKIKSAFISVNLPVYYSDSVKNFI